MHLDVLRERQLMYLKIYSLASSPCENYIAGATSAGTVAIFRANQENPQPSTESNQLCELPVMANRAYSLASTSSHLICGDSRGIIRAWKWENIMSKSSTNAEPAFVINVADCSKHSQTDFDINSMTTVQNHGSHNLYVGCGDSNIYAFDLSCGKLVRTLEGHADFIHQVLYNETKHQLFSCSEDGFIKIWDTRSAQQAVSINPSTRKTASVSSGPWVGCIAVDNSGDFLAFGGGVQMGIYSIAMASFAIALEPSSLQAHSALFCGDKLLFGGESESLYIFSVDGKLQNEIPLGIKGVYAIMPCFNNSVTAVAGTGSSIQFIRHFAYRSSSLTVC